MNTQDTKCVLVIDDQLPTGLIANTAAILGISLGRELPDLVGADLTDASGCMHRGITAWPIPILRGSRDLIKALRQDLYQPEFDQVITVDFSDLAQSCNHYKEYAEKMTKNTQDDLFYLGIGLCGPKKKINQLTGGFSLLR